MAAVAGVVAIALLAACTTASGSPAGTAPDSTSPASDPTPAGQPLEALPPDETLLQDDADDLAQVGFERYRFRSVLTIPTPSPAVSVYEARVELDPAATHLVATGYSGSFEIYLGETASYLRFGRQGWSALASGRPFRFSPAGPFPGYAAVGVIARLAIDRGAEVAGTDVVSGVETTHFVTTLADGTKIDMWLSEDGVVMTEVVSQPSEHGAVTLRWDIHDVNGDFRLSEPDAR